MAISFFLILFEAMVMINLLQNWVSEIHVVVAVDYSVETWVVFVDLMFEVAVETEELLYCSKNLATRRLRRAVLHRLNMVGGTVGINLRPNNSSSFWSLPSGFVVPYKGLENTLVSELLKGKGEEAGALYWCYTNNTVYDAIKNMAEHDIGSLVVMKPGEEASLVGIITERDYLKKIILQGRSSKLTKVEDIMTPENKLITVFPNTNIVMAMALMTEKHIRHVPVIDNKVVGMISIVDVIRTVVEQQHEEVKLLKNFIKGDYY
ncbi:CBS domain-containing protein CBSX3, mitochondrial [Zostera marina]|uniref:CBS domain-containing protein CBSX3, mitochondrial n=1 Tax=Zostera marina TaxID=29655 RepID=A0A0K9PUP8_ZOSMR|nr:CBS domain-containing protein CBSX3, mitochondrial [Zostera marina]